MKSYTSRHFAVRKIINGRVKIGGLWFTPSTVRPDPYNGELDGQWMAFGRYWMGDEPWIAPSTGRPVVSLWGTAAAFFSDDPQTDWPGPNCIDGTFHWEWWDEIRSSLDVGSS